jgi:hypothetical protein
VHHESKKRRSTSAANGHLTATRSPHIDRLHLANRRRTLTAVIDPRPTFEESRQMAVNCLEADVHTSKPESPGFGVILLK